MNNNLKKRRGYSPDEYPAERTSHPMPLSAPRNFDTQSPNSLPQHYQHILQEAPSISVTFTVSLDKLIYLTEDFHKELLQLSAESVNIEPSHLLELSTHLARRKENQQTEHQPAQQTGYSTPKRPRLDPSIAMPAPYSYNPGERDGEKAVSTGRPSQPNHQMEAPSSLGAFEALEERTTPSGWTSSRVAGCLASLAPICPPLAYTTYESQPAYQPLPTSEPYDFSNSRSSMDSGIVSRQPQTHLPPNPTPLSGGQHGVYACDDAEIVSRYLSDFPPLQPTTAAGIQPPTSAEGMVYPATPSMGRYGDHGFGQIGDMTGLGIQIQGQMNSLGPTVPMASNTTYMSTPFPRDGASPGFGQYPGFPALPAPFNNPPEGYTIKMEETPIDPYGAPRSAPYELFQHQKTVPARRGPFRDNEQRLATARTRKKGSCIRCRMQRIRCVEDEENPDAACIGCQKIATNIKAYRVDCLRLKIMDVKLFKPGQVKGLEWTLRWKGNVVGDIGGWASSELRTIRVTEGYTGQSVELQVRQFQPQKGDKLERSWVSKGVKKTKAIPAFAIVDMDAARKAFTDYIKEGLIDCCANILGSKEQLLSQAYTIALQTMQGSSVSEVEKKLITNTLDLWMSVRLTTKSFEIVGSDTLGMNRADFDNDDNPLRGKLPLPPVMGAQIDSILIHQVQPALRRSTLDDLQKMTLEKKQKTWFTTFIVTFILLHNIGLITRHDAEYARKHGMKGRWAREENVKEYNLGANTLLAYFHYCNKNTYPFSKECRDEELRNLAELDDRGINFVRYAREVVSQHQSDWQKLWENNMYEDEYYYVSQLFETNWQPRIMV